MDEEEIADKFMSMAMNEYAASIHEFIEATRVLELKVRHAMQAEDFALSTQLSANLFNAISQVKLGTMHNLITSYAHALNDERIAGVMIHEVAEEVLTDLHRFHARLVAIGQPISELLMITDLMVKLKKGLDESPYSHMTGNAPEA